MSTKHTSYQSAHSDLFSTPMFSTRRITGSNATSSTGTTTISTDNFVFKRAIECAPLPVKKHILKYTTPRGNTSPVLRNLISE